jgi:hypothetical protein
MTDITTRRTGRVVGGLFVSAFFLYGGGSLLLNGATDGATALPENAASLAHLSAGAGLMLANSVAVATIGVLAFRVLRRRDRRTASTYLASRTVEGVLLALAPLGTLALVPVARRSVETPDGTGSWLASLARAAVENSQPTYWAAMAVLGVGSVFFCRALLKSALLPRFLAVWGTVGYAILALGSVLQLAGYEVGLALSVPGGLFEVAAGSFLLVTGFREAVPVGAGSAANADDLGRTPPVLVHRRAAGTRYSMVSGGCSPTERATPWSG